METVANRIVSGEITVLRRYIFLAVGGNQVFRATKTKIFTQLKDIVMFTLAKNTVAKIFIAGVLPRPNRIHVKEFIKKYNRYVAAAVKKLQKESHQDLLHPCTITVPSGQQNPVPFLSGFVQTK